MGGSEGQIGRDKSRLAGGQGAEGAVLGGRGTGVTATREQGFLLGDKKRFGTRQKQ